MKTVFAATAGRLPAAFLCLLLAGCGAGDWFGGSEKPKLPGTRISVLQLDRRVEADPRLADVAVRLPPATVNDSWAQAGGRPDHAIGHLALGASPREVWRASIGSGTSGQRVLLARPVVAQGRVFTMDTDYNVSAFDAAQGRQVWRVSVDSPRDEGEGVGGGVAVADGRVFATTGFGDLVALDAANGSVLWRKPLGAPVRAAPTVAGNRIFVVTVDNRLVALSSQDGAPLWNHTGILESASLLGGPSPAVDGGIVLAPYSSGELFALRVENGRVAWSESLTPVRRIGSLASLADIRGMPVIDRGLVLAVSHSGRMVAIDERTGGRAWEQQIGGVNQPWAAGDFVFVLSNEAEVVALTRQAGRIRWVAQLDRFDDPESKSGPIYWSGPVLAGDRLWLTSSDGRLVALTAETGAVAAELRADSTFQAPVVAANTLYVLTDDGTLIAFR
ncbi:outer membrane protein assembly factor BamB family protein [Arenibaculum pallidiluteum]|uniref:outer membrane protein assembly factor BamB family protein n=1 Tax=Arenibaculum pallidiluteum TaxID=2812559 RepID=UPI001A96302B|nr:PQQ-binding-like beta-propeller repeat protein [Arenibaculum pallidiluteum]